MVAILGPQPFAPGLDARENAMVQILFGLGTATADELAAHSGLDRGEVERLLRELVGMGYVIREEVGGQPTYHVTMVSWAPGIARARSGRRGDGGEHSVEE